MIDEINRKVNEFIEHATDEDYKEMFSGCMELKEIPVIE